MGNLLPFFAALVLAVYSLRSGPTPPLSLPGVAAFLVAYYAAGRAVAGRFADTALEPGADPRVVLARFRRAVSLHRALALPGYAVLLFPGGWAAAGRSALGAGGDLAALAALLAPYLVLLLLAHASSYPAERRLGLQPLPYGTSLLLSVRMGGLVVAPIVLFAALEYGLSSLAAAGLEPFHAASDLAARYELAGGALLLASLAVVLAVFPVIAMRILGARPMPAGPLRERLERYARRVGLGYRNIYVWPTHGSLPNAAVMGVGRRLRCVVFTDALLDLLDEEEIEAVFAHEVGHALHRHLPIFFLFTVAFTLAMAAATHLLPPGMAAAVERDDIAGLAFGLGGMFVYFGLVFGFVSRRLEQQADVHGLLTVGLPEDAVPADVLRDPDRHPFLKAVAEGRATPAEHPFVRGLDGIAEVMGGMRELTGWRHFSLSDRIAFLDRFCRDAAVRERYRRRLRGLLALMATAFVLFAAVASADLPAQAAGAAPGAALAKAADRLSRGRPAEARPWLESGLRGAAARGRLLSPDGSRLPPGRPVETLSLLALAQAQEQEGVPGIDRFRLQECEALLRSILGRHEEAIAVGEGALRRLGDPDAQPSEARGTLQGLRAEALLTIAHLLESAGRPAAAVAAREDAAAAAAESGSKALREAAAGPGSGPK